MYDALMEQGCEVECGGWKLVEGNKFLARAGKRALF